MIAYLAGETELIELAKDPNNDIHRIITVLLNLLAVILDVTVDTLKVPVEVVELLLTELNVLFCVTLTRMVLLLDVNQVLCISFLRS